MNSFKNKCEDIEDFISYAKTCMENSELNFNYKSYIKPNDEANILFARIIEEVQYLEKDINLLIKVAVSMKKFETINQLDMEKICSIIYCN